MYNLYTVLKPAQLRWTGHVIRMPDERLPKKVFFCELQERKCSQGSQKKRYKKVQVGNDQETAQSERNSHSKNRGVVKTKLTLTHLY